MESTCDISFKVWLTDEEAQTYTGFSAKTLKKWRDEFQVTYRRLERKIIYKRIDIDKAMESGLQVFRAVDNARKDYRV